MNIAQIHNRYRQPGGEDIVAERESALLQHYGHHVAQFIDSNNNIRLSSPVDRLLTAAGTIWNNSAYRRTLIDLRRGTWDIVHVHNTFPLLSPSVIWAAHQSGLPVVMTVHNYRISCANGLLLRDNAPCTKCLGRSPMWGVRFGCYHGSPIQTIPVAGMILAHRLLGTYKSLVQRFVAPTGFSQEVLVRSGIPRDRIAIVPHFVEDSGSPYPLHEDQTARGRTIAYVGRISDEKGVDLLLSAWRDVYAEGARLLIVGDGPRKQELSAQTSSWNSVEWAGWKNQAQVRASLLESRFLVVPSRAYETFGLGVIEAFSVGTPVIAPDHGGFRDLVSNGVNGYRIPPNHVHSLRDAISGALDISENQWRVLSEGARGDYERQFSPSAHYRALLDVYEAAIDENRGRAR